VNHDTPSYREHRGLALAFASCGLATLTLLVNHPNDGAHTFAEFIKYEARNQFIDGLVHGGFIFTLGALSVCFVFLSRSLGATRAPVVIGLVAFFMGCGALTLSMILDGFATPAIAARFVGTDGAEGLQTAKTLLILIGTLIRFLMPTGLLLQSVAVLSWSTVIAAGHGLQRAVGLFGAAAALALIIGVFAAPAALSTHVLLGGILLQALWYLALAVVLFRRDLERVNTQPCRHK